MTEAADDAKDRRDLAAQAIGATAGNALGMLGPEFVVASGPLGVAVERVVGYALARFQSRPQERAELALVAMAEETRDRRAKGERLREDGFFEARDDGWPDADELLEGMLLHAANAYQAKKVPLLGRLYAGVAHHEEVSADEAHYLLQIVDEMPYRQFVAMAVLQRREEHDAHLAIAEGDRRSGRSRPDRTVLLELDDLARRGLVGIRQKDGTIADPTALWGGGPMSSQSYDMAELTPTGWRIAGLLDLAKVSLGERAGWIKGIGGPSPLRRPT